MDPFCSSVPSRGSVPAFQTVPTVPQQADGHGDNCGLGTWAPWILAYPLAVPNSELGRGRDGHTPRPLVPRPHSALTLQPSGSTQSSFGVYMQDQ